MLKASTVQSKVMIEELGFVGLKLVLALGTKKELGIRELIAEARVSSSSIYRALTILYKYNLIKERSLYGRRLISLTKKGEKFAKLILEAERVLSED